MAAPVPPLTLDLKATFNTAAPGDPFESTPFFDPDQPTPPAKLEYLIALEQLCRGAATTPYACTGLNFNHNDSASADGLWRWAERYAPGAKALRASVTRSLSTSVTGNVAPAEVTATVSVPGSGDRVDIPSSQANGFEVYPLTAITLIDRTSDEFISSPSDGDNRLLELTPTRAATIEEYEGQHLFGFGGQVRGVLDLTPL